MPDAPWLVINGDLINGFEFTGPFSAREEAVEWAKRNFDTDWWLDILVKPDIITPP